MMPPEPNKRKIGFLIKERAHATEKDNSSHFDVSGILETWKFRLGSVLERLNLEHLNRLRPITT
jgi:hypothetical protein